MELLKFDIRYIDIATDYMKGLELEHLSLKYTIPEFRLTEILSLPEIKRYSDSYIANIGYLNRAKRARLISKLIDDKLEENKEAEITSRKDIAELVKLAQDEEKLAISKQPTVQINQQENNYNNFTKGLYDDEPIDVH